jgi:hypothetical protein
LQLLTSCVGGHGGSGSYEVERELVKYGDRSLKEIKTFY